MPMVTATEDDFLLFIESLKIAEILPPEKKITAYLKELKLKKILPMTEKEMQSYFDILGYLNILHSDRHFGTSVKFIAPNEMEDPVEFKNDYGYPVRHWKAKYGVDWARVHELFDGIFLDRNSQKIPVDEVCGNSLFSEKGIEVFAQKCYNSICTLKKK